MPTRAIWTGHLRFSLVTIPVRVYPARNAAATIHFHQLHRSCLTRIQYKKWCPTHEAEVPNDEIVKGYEVSRGHYVALEEADIAKVRPESTRVIHLQQFARAEAIDPLLFDEPYYLAPDGKAAAEPFAVMREALAGKAGIGTVAFHGRERLVAVEPREEALVMLTLRHVDELRALSGIPELSEVPKKVKPAELALARKVIGEPDTRIDFSKYSDTYEDALREMIGKKVEGREIVASQVEKAPRVVNLMDALRKSLDEVSAHKKRPARAAAKKTPRAVKAAARKSA